MPEKFPFSAVGNLAGGLLSFFGQQSANKANMQINREQIQAQKDLQKSANDFTEDMWNKTNDYNSPSAQRKRLLQAGINPLSAEIGSQQAQPMSGAAGSAPSPIAMQNEMAAFSGVGSALQDSLLKHEQSKLVREEAKKLELQNKRSQLESNALDEPFMFIEGSDGKTYPISDSLGHMSIGEALAYKKLRLDYDLLKPQLQKAKAEANTMSYNEKMAELDAKNKENAIKLDNAIKEAQDLNLKAGARLSDQKVQESIKTIEKIDADIKYIGKLIILADDEHSLNQVNIRLAELQETLSSESKKLLKEGWSTDAIGALFKALLVNLVNNIGINIGGSVSKKIG